MARIISDEWVEVHKGDVLYMDGSLVMRVTYTLSDAFCAFRASLLYSAHKYYPRLL